MRFDIWATVGLTGFELGLALTMFEDDESIFAAMRAGARGYLLKGADRGEIGRALGAVSHGEAIFRSAISDAPAFPTAAYRRWAKNSAMSPASRSGSSAAAK